MKLDDLYRLSPELSMVGLAVLLITLDLALSSKRSLPVVALVGLAVPLGFSIALWADLNGDLDSWSNQTLGVNTAGVGSMTGIFNTLVVARDSIAPV